MRDSTDFIEPSQVASLFRDLNKITSQIEPAIHDLWKSYANQAPGPLPTHQMEKINFEFRDIVDKIDETIHSSSRILSLLMMKQEKPEINSVSINITSGCEEECNYPKHLNIFKEIKEVDNTALLERFSEFINNESIALSLIYQDVILSCYKDKPRSHFLLPLCSIMCSDPTYVKVRHYLFRVIMIFSIAEESNEEDTLSQERIDEIIRTIRLSNPLLLLNCSDTGYSLISFVDELNELFPDYHNTIQIVINSFTVSSQTRAYRSISKKTESEPEKKNQVHANLVAPPPCVVRRSRK